METHASRQRGWPIAAIVRHVGRDRKTIRAYLRQERVPGVRRRAAAEPLAPYAPYLAVRFADTAHILA